ncbi:MAG: DUF5107 domain-containing protein [Candidatus Hydrogenedentes bacterium]|nr:DUF5107 domain-containing protein [Candidatus Hydrogenedentota bacterium]
MDSKYVNADSNSPAIGLCAAVMVGLALLLLACAPCFAQAAAGAPVETKEGTITLPTYPWYDDVNPVFNQLEASIYYPYTRQDLLGPEKSDRTYRTLVLENEYLRVTCIPELGGRIHSVFDKTTNEEMYHKNNEIKPALIAMRGAWISGGIEWNAGPQGHTVTIVSPVDVKMESNPDGSASLLVANMEMIFRTRWTVRLTLHPGKAYLDEEISIANQTDGVQPYYFWNCTAFPNLKGTRFIYPMSLGTDHGGTNFFTWPMHEGKDITWLKNYPTMSSVFGYDCVFDFFGAYDVDRDRGIVSFANHDNVRGKKAWTWGKDDFGVTSQMSLSDAGPIDAQYIEVQSGPLLTQADYGMLKPRDAVAWQEFWYPAHGLGDGFEYATRDAVVNAKRDGGKLNLVILSTAEFPAAHCILSREDKVLLDQTLDLSPSKPAQVSLPSAPEGPVKLELRSSNGDVLLSYETPLDIPKVDVPDLTRKPARTDGLPTADELYHEAYLLDSQSDALGARAGYEKVLTVDPKHIPALNGLATLDIEQGLFAQAAEHAKQALARDRNDGWAWYLSGVANFRLGNYDEVLRCMTKAQTLKQTQAVGYNLAGRAYVRMKRYDEAVAAFKRAASIAPGDARNRAELLAVEVLCTNPEAAKEAAAAYAQDPNAFVFCAIAASNDPEKLKAAAQDLIGNAGEVEFNAMEVATFFSEMEAYAAARNWLNAYAEAAAAAPKKPSALVEYALAYYSAKSGDEAGAKTHLAQGSKASVDYVHPHGVEAAAIFDYAVKANPNDANARLFLGYALAGLLRIDEALPCWQKAVELKHGLSTAWRLLGLHAWKTAKNLPEAERCYRKAIEARPGDQLLYRDLCNILDAQNKRKDGITLAESAPKGPTPRYDLALWLADAYSKEGRYDDCINLLANAHFSNWEGSSQPRDIYVEALMARGKQRYDKAQYAEALQDFELALTYPANLGVGARYALTDAETRYWIGRTYLALGKRDEAKAAWEFGAKEYSSKDKPLVFIPLTDKQNEYVAKCATALEVLATGS